MFFIFLMVICEFVIKILLFLFQIWKKSKVYVGGLQEGDVLFCLNGVFVKGKIYEVVMYLVDNVGDKFFIDF